MRITLLATLGSALSAIIVMTSSASAVCTPAAPQSVLQAFKDLGGVAWIAANGRAANVGDQVLALAAQAVNTKDPDFKKPFADLLGASSNDAGKAIGRSLRRLENSCGNPKDPSDPSDKLYISANILPFLLSSYSANQAFGEGDGPATASTGAGGLGSPGGGTSSGSGSTGALPQGGGSNNGDTAADDSTSTPTAGRTAPTASAGGIGSSATEGDVTTGSDTNL